MALPPIPSSLDRLPEKSRRLFELTYRMRERVEKRRLAPPLIRLWDGDYNIAYRLDHIAVEASFQWKLNDTGAATIRMPLEHDAAQWALDPFGRKKRNMNITMDKDGARWSGVVKTTRIVKGDDGGRFVQMEALHDYEMLKRIYCWPNPFLPAAVQFPRAFVLAGPVEWVLKTALWCNLYRLYGAVWAIPDNPLNALEWAKNKVGLDWPIVVKPTPDWDDLTQPWTIFSSRMKTWHDAAEGALNDSEMYVECRRYLAGDPPPWPGAIVRHGALVVDIVDKSAIYSETGAGALGDLYKGIARVVRRVEVFGESAGLDFSTTVIDEPLEVPEYRLPFWRGTIASSPYVVYRDGEVSGVESIDFAYEPATATQFITGGQSMPGINAGISAAIQTVGNTLGEYVYMDEIGTIADQFLRPIYEDTILAWICLKSLSRSYNVGWARWMEYFVDGADKAFTLSSIVALRQGYWQTRERYSHQMGIADGSPWFIGDQGEGDFFLGDRIAATVRGLPGRQMVVERVSELTYTLSRESRGWSATMGDFSATQSGLERLIQGINSATRALHDLGVN